MGIDCCIQSDEAIKPMPAKLFTTLPGFPYYISTSQFANYLCRSINRGVVNEQSSESMTRFAPALHCFQIYDSLESLSSFPRLTSRADTCLSLFSPTTFTICNYTYTQSFLSPPHHSSLFAMRASDPVALFSLLHLELDIRGSLSSHQSPSLFLVKHRFSHSPASAIKSNRTIHYQLHARRLRVHTSFVYHSHI